MKKIISRSVLFLLVFFFAFSGKAYAGQTVAGTVKFSDSTFFKPEWKEYKLSIQYLEQQWNVGFDSLQNEDIQILINEDGSLSCQFVNPVRFYNLTKTVDAALVDMPFPDAVGTQYCFQLIDGFEPWLLDVICKELITGIPKDIEIQLNQYTCSILTVEAVKAYALQQVDLMATGEYILAGTCTTSFKGSSANRINNIRVSAGHFNGLNVAPGQSISASTVFQPRTPANGYKSAGVYSGGKVVSGIGGGICQVSSTIYNAIMNAGLQVTSRHPHSSPVAYLPLGTDAAISAGAKDLCFVNNYPNPIHFETKVEGNDLTINVYVKASDMGGLSYKLWSAKRGGLSADTYLKVFQNGVEIENRYVGRSSYRALSK